MADPTPPAKNWRKRTHRWVQIGFLIWAVISTLWLANSVRTKGVDEDLILSGNGVSVVDGERGLDFIPSDKRSDTGLIFFCGSGVSALAYAPLLRPLADAGHLVFIIKLPYRFAPLDSHKTEAIARALSVITEHPEIAHWVISGHSLGGALAAQMAKAYPQHISGLVLIGTTHPKLFDLSSVPFPVTKVYASIDGIAPVDRVLANKPLLPKQSKWVLIDGGNHAQFGHYGPQLFDGDATISRDAQQLITRSALLETLTNSVKFSASK